MDIESVEYDFFIRNFRQGKFGEQRLGQAFYNHFKLHKLSDQESVNRIYEKNDKDALNIINSVFRLT